MPEKNSRRVVPRGHERKGSRKGACRSGGPYNWLSKERRRADALALGADERRDKLRKAAVRGTYPVTRGCLNGETRQGKTLSSIRQSITCGGEPGELKHLSSRRKRKKQTKKRKKERPTCHARQVETPREAAQGRPCMPETVKQKRAQGGCPGTGSR